MSASTPTTTGTHGLLLAEHVRTLASGPGALHVAAFVRHAWRDFGRNHAPVVMEMGAGGGWNLAALPADWTRVGYDTDLRYLVAGREAFGIDMRNGFIDDVLPDLGTADVVLLSHVLEHISDPVGTLQRIAGAARPDALILIEVPGIFRLHKRGMDPMRYWQNAHSRCEKPRVAMIATYSSGLKFMRRASLWGEILEAQPLNPLQRAVCGIES